MQSAKPPSTTSLKFKTFEKVVSAASVPHKIHVSAFIKPVTQSIVNQQENPISIDAKVVINGNIINMRSYKGKKTKFIAANTL